MSSHRDYHTFSHTGSNGPHQAKNTFESGQNVWIHIILCIRKVSSGPLFSIHAYLLVSCDSFSGQWRPWSDCVDVQLIWAYTVRICPKTHFCMTLPKYTDSKRGHNPQISFNIMPFMFNSFLTQTKTAENTTNFDQIFNPFTPRVSLVDASVFEIWQVHCCKYCSSWWDDSLQTLIWICTVCIDIWSGFFFVFFVFFFIIFVLFSVSQKTIHVAYTSIICKRQETKPERT